MLGNRSKSAISIREPNDNSQSSPERNKSGIISPEPKKSLLSNLNLNKSKQKLEDKMSTTRVRSETRVKSGIWNRKDDSRKNEKKKMALSSLDLNRKHDSDDMKNVPKPCNCDDQSSQMASSHLVTRWDSLILLLLGVMVIILIMSAPLSLFFARRFER